MALRSLAFNDDLVSAQVRHWVEQLRAIGDISRAINASLHPGEVLAKIVSSAAQLLGAELSWLGEFDGASDRYQFSAGYELGGEPGLGEELGPEFAGWFELGEGPVARALRAGQPIQLADVEAELSEAPAAPFQHRSWSMRRTLSGRGIHSVVVAPMIFRSRLLGFLGVGTAARRGFSPDEVALLTTLADHSSVAIENARLYQAERDRELQALNVLELTRAVSSSLILDDVLKQAASGLANAVGIPNCTIYLYDPEAESLTARHWVGHGPDQAAGPAVIPAGANPFLHDVLAKRRAIVVADAATAATAATDRACAPEMAVLHGAKSLLGVPFLARDRVLGLATLATYKRPYQFRPAQVTLAMSMATSVALAIENALLYERGREMSIAEERNRLAREIHDTLAQGLTGIVLQLEAAEQVMPPGTPEALAHLNKARTLARDSLQEARRSLWNLRPGPLEHFSLPEALLREVQELGSTESVEATFACAGEAFQLPPDAQTCLLRTAQEALANVRRHARARHVAVTLTWRPTNVCLAIVDDGCGFDPACPPPRSAGGGFGLVGMRERCRLARAALKIESTPGQGTRISVSLPRRSDG
ncbi:MAG: sensor histidine kinase [Chloroflexota bacterium]